MEIVFEREALFKEVWETPISTLAKKYSLSDNGLRKVCKALSIPLPQRGYWAKIAAGHPPQIPPHPPTTGTTQFISRPDTNVPTYAGQDDDSKWLAGRLTFEKSPANFIAVQEKLVRPHAFVTSTLRALEATRKKFEKSRALADKPRKHAARYEMREPNFESFSTRSWRDYLHKGHLSISGDVLPLRVSLETADRALCIWDAIIKACAARDIQAELKGARLQLKCENVKVDLRISEGLKQIVGSTQGLSTFQIMVKEHIRNVGTGELRIFVEHRGTNTKFADAPGKPLESQLNAVFCRIYRCVISDRMWLARFEEARRLNEIAEQRQQAERALREEQNRLREEEKRREEQLLNEASTWCKAEQIRAYIAHLSCKLNSADSNVSPELTAWIKWASAVAEKLDPTTRRLDREQ